MRRIAGVAEWREGDGSLAEWTFAELRPAGVLCARGLAPEPEPYPVPERCQDVVPDAVPDKAPTPERHIPLRLRVPPRRPVATVGPPPRTRTAAPPPRRPGIIVT